MDAAKAIEMWRYSVEEYINAIQHWRDNSCAITLHHLMARSHELRIAEIAMRENNIDKPVDELDLTELHYLMMNRWFHAKEVAILNSKPFEIEPMPLSDAFKPFYTAAEAVDMDLLDATRRFLGMVTAEPEKPVVGAN